MKQYLQETAKRIGIDMVDPGLCHFVWKVCNSVVFEEMRSSDFDAFINLHENAIVPTIRDRQIGKMCYVLHELSKFHNKKSLADQWLDTMLDQLKISKDTYTHHCYINTSSKVSKKFAGDIQTVIKQVKEIGLY